MPSNELDQMPDEYRRVFVTSPLLRFILLEYLKVFLSVLVLSCRCALGIRKGVCEIRNTMGQDCRQVFNSRHPGSSIQKGR